MTTRFRDREQAGRLLAKLVREYVDETPVVLALPRGGVAVGYELARALDAPLDVMVVRKLGVPWHPELGMGALAEGGALYLNQEVLASTDVSPEEVREVIFDETRELERRVQRYRGGRPLQDVKGRTVVLVDDGLATGGTARAAVRALRSFGARSIILAVPVAAAETAEALREQVDTLVCVQEPENLWAIGTWYDDFHQMSDEEVLVLLDQAQRTVNESPASP
ncbi:phosphoribosyltransferase [Hyalangium versicolor]|uniref:phosphoribosyltransferase n=1 Tax=Hyalangium versicolor TaxID=2861190 RepID=UPI001CC9E094|nr:phosphoribosyltransferase [Hyalangium versicolor]